MRRFTQAILAALLVNGFLLVAAAQLVRDRPQPQDITVPTAVSLVNVPKDKTPEEETERKMPEPPQQQPHLDFAPELPVPSLTAPTLAGPAVALDLTRFGDTAPMGAIAFEAGELDHMPQALVHTAPQYPYRARQRHIEGSVKVRFLVSIDGTTSRITILESRPAGVFNQVVIDAVARWRFEPGKLAGKSVPAWMITPITFDLDGGR